MLSHIWSTVDWARPIIIQNVTSTVQIPASRASSKAIARSSRGRIAQANSRACLALGQQSRQNFALGHARYKAVRELGPDFNLVSMFVLVLAKIKERKHCRSSKIQRVPSEVHTNTLSARKVM
jgi:hypothetical protein